MLTAPVLSHSLYLHHDRMKLGTPKSCTGRYRIRFPRAVGGAVLRPDFHKSTHSPIPATGSSRGTYRSIRPENAELPPLQCRQVRAQRPEVAEEIPAFHRARIRHSRRSDPALVQTRTPPHRLASPGPSAKAPPECRTSRSHCTTSGHGTFTPRPTVQRRSWKTRQAS